MAKAHLSLKRGGSSSCLLEQLWQKSLPHSLQWWRSRSSGLNGSCRAAGTAAEGTKHVTPQCVRTCHSRHEVCKGAAVAQQAACSTVPVQAHSLSAQHQLDTKSQRRVKQVLLSNLAHLTSTAMAGVAVWQPLRWLHQQHIPLRARRR
jgi:hypothetical protein